MSAHVSPPLSTVHSAINQNLMQRVTLGVPRPRIFQTPRTAPRNPPWHRLPACRCHSVESLYRLPRKLIFSNAIPLMATGPSSVAALETQNRRFPGRNPALAADVGRDAELGGAARLDRVSGRRAGAAPAMITSIAADVKNVDQTSAARLLPMQVLPSEKQAASGTALRSFSPQDIADMGFAAAPARPSGPAPATPWRSPTTTASSSAPTPPRSP